MQILISDLKNRKFWNEVKNKWRVINFCSQIVTTVKMCYPVNIFLIVIRSLVIYENQLNYDNQI